MNRISFDSLVIVATIWSASAVLAMSLGARTPFVVLLLSISTFEWVLVVLEINYPKK